MRRHGRRDRNHADVVGLYRSLGCFVLDLGNVGQGCPDLLIHCDGGLALVEVKAEKGTLTSDQQRFLASWPVTIVRTLEDVVIHVGNMRKRAYR